MTTFRTQKTNNFTVVRNEFINDPGLSAKAKGILLYLLSKPDNWETRLEDIERHMADGIDSIKSGVRELKSRGYMVRNRRHFPDGRFQWETLVLEVPISVAQSAETPAKSESYPSVENPPMGVPSVVRPWGENPSMGKPSVEKPSMGNPLLINTDLVSTDLVITELPKTEDISREISNPESLVADATDDREPDDHPTESGQMGEAVAPNSQTASNKNPSPVQPECSKPPENKQAKGRGKDSAAAQNPLFVEFWAVYPRKVGKPQAEKAFAKVPADIAHQLPAIVEQQKIEYRTSHPGTTDWRYFPHPTTYLNQQRWEAQEEAIAPTTTEFSPDFLRYLASAWIPALPGYNGAQQNIHQAKDWCIRAGAQRVEVAYEAYRDRCQREAALSQPSSLIDIEPASPETRQAVAANIRALLGEKRHAV